MYGATRLCSHNVQSEGCVSPSPLGGKYPRVLYLSVPAILLSSGRPKPWQEMSQDLSLSKANSFEEIVYQEFLIVGLVLKNEILKTVTEPASSLSSSVKVRLTRSQHGRVQIQVHSS